MNKLFTTLSLLALCLTVRQAYAQEMLGAANSNYAGTNGLHLNPSSMIDSRLRFDLNLFTIGASADNDYIYVPKEQMSFFSLKNPDNLSKKDLGYTDAGNFDINNLSKTYKAYESVLARVPSAMFHIKDNYFAIVVQARSTANANDVPAPLAKFAYEGTFQYPPLYGKTFSFSNFKLNTLSWGEVAISYGHELIKSDADYLNGAITVKRLYGSYAGYINASASGVNVVNDSILMINSADIEYAKSFTGDDSTFSKVVNGRGWGFDFGFTYEYRPENEQHYYNMDGQRLIDPTYNRYKWKVGLSFLDLGKINYKDAGVHRLTGSPNVNNFDTIKTDGDNIDETLSAIFYNGDSLASKKASEFDVALPHAVSIQVDYHIGKKFYSNLTWIYGFQGKNGPTANNMLALVPRYETKNFEVDVPLTLYQYNKFRLGLALRAYCLTIGSEKLGALMGISDMYGMDAYVSLRIPLAKHRIKDKDKDEVSDMMDKCPEVKGTWATLGCPDRDGDGITDVQDSCPDVKGIAQFHGCPDTDGDGITDKEDLCPDKAGLALFKGCPDMDGDSIEDRLDSCPAVAGLPKFNGCPDTDNDGVEDRLDSCPNVAGLSQFHGCPDTDSDGIEDRLDSCPLVAGPPSNNGCPIVKKEPVKVELSTAEQEVINKVFSNLEFETGKWVIRPSSYASLDELAALLKRKPSFKLLIDGHTDNVGSATSNMRLSKNRAESVKTYLVNKGIEASRITAKGYGLTQPVASNKTAEGRQKNRRVEFTIVE